MNYNILGERYIPFGKGVDFARLYLIDQKTGKFFPESVRDQTTEDAEALARKFYGWKPMAERSLA
jgi:hypothetical protein